MKATTSTALLDEMLDRVIRVGDDSVREDLAAIIREDVGSLEHLHHELLAALLSRSLTAREVRRAAELLADVEQVRRREIRNRMVSSHSGFDAIRSMYARLPATPRTHLPVAVTTQVCHDLGFAKSMYSAVRGNIWAPVTIAIHNELGGFSALRRAVNGHVVPKGAAPREEGIMRTPRGMAVEYADTLRDTYKSLIDLSKPQGYVVVPVVAAGQVRALIHADRHHVAIDSSDLEVLRTVGDICAVVEETTLVRSRIESRNREIRDELIAMQSALSDLETSRLTLTEAAVTDTGGPSDCGRAPRELTARENEIFELVACGHANAAIAQRLFVSEGTVKSHLRRIYRKLGVGTRAEAAAAYRTMPPNPGIGESTFDAE